MPSNHLFTRALLASSLGGWVRKLQRPIQGNGATEATVGRRKRTRAIIRRDVSGEKLGEVSLSARDADE
jgi:hypothetical protein